jgi:hypothetical protein
MQSQATRTASDDGDFAVKGEDVAEVAKLHVRFGHRKNDTARKVWGSSPKSVA